MSGQQFIRRILSQPRITTGIAVLGGIFYAIQTWSYAHTQASVLDEGLYLYKGLLFANGRYWPFQDFGPWTNHMPLSFLIPGYLQKWFGPGLRTGRYFTIILGIFTVLGIWIIARRLGNKWWAAGAVWLLAINPAPLKMYSIALSQQLIASMVVWTLALSLDEGRSLWQTTTAAGLAALAVMTRLNLAPFLPILIGYIFWQHGKRAGLWATGAGLSIVVVGHTLYWPGILQMYAYWFPVEVAPFLNPWRHPDATLFWDPSIDITGRVKSLFDGFRFHFLALMGILGAGLLWPAKDKWRRSSDFRSAVFLALAFLTLIAAHAWASLGNNYCVFCFPLYLGFFSFLGLLSLIATFQIWRETQNLPRQLWISALILIISAGIGYAAFEELDWLLEIRVPRLRSMLRTGVFPPGTIRLRLLLEKQFQIERYLARRLVPISTGLAIGILTLALAFAVYLLFFRKRQTNRRTFGYLAIVIFLVIGLLLSPSIALGGGFQTYNCGGDTIAAYEAAGSHLAAHIPPGAHVYWKGGLSPAPLLYIPEAQIYPAQLNGDYTYRIGGNPTELERFGLWNLELAQQWASESDFILIEERYYEGWLKDFVNSGNFDELPKTPSTAVCRDNASIRIFRRNF